MKRALTMVLLAVLTLSACRQENIQESTKGDLTQQTEVLQVTTEHLQVPNTEASTATTTEPTMPQETDATEQGGTKPSDTESVQHTHQTATQPSEPPVTVAAPTETAGMPTTVPTETTPTYPPTTASTEPTQPPNVTEPVSQTKSTEPAPTVPTTTVPTTTVPPQTDPQITTQPATTVPIVETSVPEEIDTAKLEKYGRNYAADTYGYEGDAALDITNAGAFPGVTVTINTMQEGYAAAERAVDRQYNHDMGMGYSVVVEIDGVLCRAKINLCFEPTDDPNIFILWCFYR